MFLSANADRVVIPRSFVPSKRRNNQQLLQTFYRPRYDIGEIRTIRCLAKKIRIERFHLRFSRNELLRIYNDFIPSYRHAPNYRSFFFLPLLCLASLEEEEGSSERAHVRWIARKIKASPFGETTTRRL